MGYPVNAGVLGGVVCAVSVVAGTGAIVANSRSLNTPVTARTGAGVYTVTLPAASGIDILDCAPLLTTHTADTYGVVIQASDVLFNVTTFNNAGAATDAAFSLVLIRKGRGPG